MQRDALAAVPHDTDNGKVHSFKLFLLWREKNRVESCAGKIDVSDQTQDPLIHDAVCMQ